MHAEPSSSTDLGPTITITIPGPPVGKANTVAGGKRIVPTKETRAYMNFVRALAKMGAPPEPWTGAVEVTITWYIVPTEGWDAHRKARALEGKVFAKVKPDNDNIEKSIHDAMSKVIYKDDCQIVDNHTMKFYGPEAKAVVTVRLLESVPTQTRLL